MTTNNKVQENQIGATEWARNGGKSNNRKWQLKLKTLSEPSRFWSACECCRVPCQRGASPAPCSGNCEYRLWTRRVLASPTSPSPMALADPSLLFLFRSRNSIGLRIRSDPNANLSGGWSSAPNCGNANENGRGEEEEEEFSCGTIDLERETVREERERRERERGWTDRNWKKPSLTSGTAFYFPFSCHFTNSVIPSFSVFFSSFAPT